MCIAKPPQTELALSKHMSHSYSSSFAKLAQMKSEMMKTTTAPAAMAVADIQWSLS
jgi:hypothetical protein